ncbi:hypothetical protein [Pseudolactococcus carnosus]|uniref:hypothetical protein n=1 Tax=Pseudolactococcus carnosus TaxID=2749961 RepID=UPI001FBBA688|nr:hypothetical protein [Lactococcus carnosus]
MVKYSYELKQQVIKDYLDGLGGYMFKAKITAYSVSFFAEVSEDVKTFFKDNIGKDISYTLHEEGKNMDICINMRNISFAEFTFISKII